VNAHPYLRKEGAASNSRKVLSCGGKVRGKNLSPTRGRSVGSYLSSSEGKGIILAPFQDGRKKKGEKKGRGEV